MNAWRKLFYSKNLWWTRDDYYGVDKSCIGAIVQKEDKWWILPYQTYKLGSFKHDIGPFDHRDEAMECLIEWNVTIAIFIELLGQLEGVEIL